MENEEWQEDRGQGTEGRQVLGPSGLKPFIRALMGNGKCLIFPCFPCFLWLKCLEIFGKALFCYFASH